MSQLIDLAGQQFHRLTVHRLFDISKGRARWECLCSCGSTTIVTGKRLRTGHTKSCGCLTKEQFHSMVTKHGLADHKLYPIWNNMKSRCSNSKSTDYKNYGGRGITVCHEWLTDFIVFHTWAIKQPNYDMKGYTLDRINNDDGYSPNNCRFATRSEQNYNRRPMKRYSAAQQEIQQLQKLNWLLLQYALLSSDHETSQEKTIPPKNC